MSALPQRTRILVKDLIFQLKYNLSHSQTDLMAYLVNVIYWATNVDGYFVIATSKIMSDLPEMGQKTIEANLKVLKDLGLIESKIVEVTQWRGKPKLRGIKLTEKGAEYNSKLVLPPQDERVKKLEKEKKELEKKNRELEETIKRLSVLESETSTPNEPKNETENPKPSTPTMPTANEVEIFTAEVTKHFGKNSQPICNLVPKFLNETTFYINSYNRLSIITPQGKYKQLTDPIPINRFWKWLYEHQDRIGKVIDFTKSLDLKELKERYLGLDIVLGDKKFIIDDLVEVESGVKIKVRDKNSDVIRFAIDSQTTKDAVFSLGDCEKVIWKCQKL